MKKILLTTLSAAALLATSAQADTNFKSGFKVGGGVGYKRHSVKNATNFVTTSAFVQNEALSKSSADNTLSFGLHAGYDFIINRFLAGVEVDYRYSPSKVNLNFNTTQALLGAAGVPFEAEQTHKHDFGLSLRLGGLVTENVALYAIGNLRLGKFQHKFRNKKPGSFILGSTKSKYLWGYGGGIGARYALPKNLELGIEATYDIYQKLNIGGSDVTLPAPGPGRIAQVNTQSKRPHVFNLVLKISKTF